MWWGFSPPLDFQEEINEDVNFLEFLIVGESDARHIIKTISSSYKHPKRKLKFHVIEPTLEQINRSIFFLSTCLEKNLGLQETTRFYLEILGNTLLRPATAKFLVQRAQRLSDIPTKNLECPWLNLEFLKHRDKDQIESIFKFWERATRESIPIIDYWNRRLRKSLETRYDYRDGAFDWDFHMVLKARKAPHLTNQEYRFWRENGIAFTWIEGEPARSNPTLISNVIPEGSGFFHFAYLGDIKNGPFFTWSLDELSTDKKLRSTDAAEKEVMRSIYEIRNKEPMFDEVFLGHRDPSVLNGTIVTEMPSCQMEQESWSKDKFRIEKIDLEWISIPDIEIIYHPIGNLCRFKEKEQFLEKFSLIFLAHNLTKHIPDLAPLLKRNCPLVVESRKFLTELRKEDLDKFSVELKKLALENGLRNLNDFHAEKQMFARFCRN